MFLSTTGSPYQTTYCRLLNIGRICIGYKTLFEKGKIGFAFSQNTSKDYLKKKKAFSTSYINKLARYEQFLLFPQCFQKTCTADT